MSDSANDTLGCAPQPCPSCGHCPTCGRGGVGAWGWQPIWHYYQPIWTTSPTLTTWTVSPNTDTVVINAADAAGQAVYTTLS